MIMNEELNILNSSDNNHIHTTSEYCKCNCSCEDICFCEIFCSLVHPNNSDNESIQKDINFISNNDDDINNDEDISIMKQLRYLIIYIHTTFGHHSFQQIFTDFQSGQYDDLDFIKQQFTSEQLSNLKAVSHKTSYKKFSCFDCIMCNIRAKNHQKTSSKPIHNIPMRKGYMDIVGPFPIGVGNIRYAFLLIDEDSDFALVSPTVGRDVDKEIKPAIHAWRLHSRDNGWQMQILHMDSDTIFKKQEFQQWLNGLEINAVYAPPGQHHVNTLVERFAQTIKNNAKAMIKASGLPIRYWFYAFLHAVFLHNRTLRIKRGQRSMNPRKISPYQIFYGSKWTGPLPAWGQLVISRKPVANDQPKLDDRGRECAFLGIDPYAHNSYILLNLQTKSIIRSRDTIIIKNTYAWTKKSIKPSDGPMVAGNLIPQSSSLSSTDEQLNQFDQAHLLRQQDRNVVSDISSSLPHEQSDSSELPPARLIPDMDEDAIQTRRSRRIAGLNPEIVNTYCVELLNQYFDSCNLEELHSHPFPAIQSSFDVIDLFNFEVVPNILSRSKYLPDICYVEEISPDDQRQLAINFEKQPSPNYDELSINATRLAFQPREKVIINGKLEEVPRNYKEAILPQYYEKYGPAMLEEAASFSALNALTEPTLSLPPGVKPISTRWTYKAKIKKDGSLDKFKARLVVRGFQQEILKHYTSTYSPTAFKESIRFLIYLVTVCKFDCFLLDVKSAFLQAPIDCEIWIKYPEGFPNYNPKVQQYCQLLKAVYGTKQAAKMFDDYQAPKLLQAGYTRGIHDQCAWYKWSTCKKLTLILTHVDDIPGASQDPKEKFRLIYILQQHYDLTINHAINKLLGVLLHTNINGDTIHFNNNYWDTVIEELKLQHLKPSKTLNVHKVKYLPNLTTKASPEMIKFYQIIVIFD